jgi:hypothetical protein
VRVRAGLRDYFVCIRADYRLGCGGKLTEYFLSLVPRTFLVRGIFALCLYLSYSLPETEASHGKRQ